MKSKCFITGLVVALLNINPTGFAQLAIIKAASKTVDIRDGAVYQKAVWTLMPEIRPDSYLVQRGPNKRRVSFITDIDSISFEVEKGKQYDFIILLNGKDSCYTRIVTENPNKLSYTKKCRNCEDKPDTIPFHLGRDNKIYIKGRINNSNPLDLMFDTGSDRVVLSGSGKRKVSNLQVDDKELSRGFGGTNEVALSKINQVEIEGLQWKNVPISLIEKADADGIIGFPLFDEKVLEIDYHQRQMIVHKEVPQKSSTYKKLEMQFRQNLPFIPVTLLHGSQSISAVFEFDTGANGGLFIDHAFADAENLRALKKIGETRSSGMGDNLIYNDRVLLPKLVIGNDTLNAVPVDLEQPSQSPNLQWSILGMNVLKRFDVLLDYRNNVIYLKPNKLFHSDYSSTVNIHLVVLIAIAVLLLVATILFLNRRSKINRSR